MATLFDRIFAPGQGVNPTQAKPFPPMGGLTSPTSPTPIPARTRPIEVTPNLPTRPAGTNPMPLPDIKIPDGVRPGNTGPMEVPQARNRWKEVLLNALTGALQGGAQGGLGGMLGGAAAAGIGSAVSPTLSDKYAYQTRELPQQQQQEAILFERQRRDLELQKGQQQMAAQQAQAEDARARAGSRTFRDKLAGDKAAQDAQEVQMRQREAESRMERNRYMNVPGVGMVSIPDRKVIFETPQKDQGVSPTEARGAAKNELEGQFNIEKTAQDSWLGRREGELQKSMGPLYDQWKSGVKKTVGEKRDAEGNFVDANKDGKPDIEEFSVPLTAEEQQQLQKWVGDLDRQGLDSTRRGAQADLDARIAAEAARRQAGGKPRGGGSAPANKQQYRTVQEIAGKYKFPAKK